MPHFNTYPVTADMGLRESINAMLSHVAYNRHDFGYLPAIVHAANHEGLLRDYPELITDDSGVLKLATYVNNSIDLADLTDSLVSLCNDYPSYDDELFNEVEHARVLSLCETERAESDPSADEIASALYEMGVIIEQSEYGANVSEDDYRSAIDYVKREETRELAEAAGQTELF